MAGTQDVVLHYGRFGASVAEHLKRGFGFQTDVPEAWIKRGAPTSDRDIGFLAVVGSRPLRKICQELDGLCWAIKRPWISCELTDTTLIIGPHVVPGASGCYICAIRRQDSHRANMEEVEWQRAYETYFDSAPDIEIVGYTPAMVGLAVEAIAGTRDGCGLPPGSIREITFPNVSLRQGTTVALHGCPRCREVKDRPGDRFVAELERHLHGFWNT